MQPLGSCRALGLLLVRFSAHATAQALGAPPPPLPSSPLAGDLGAIKPPPPSNAPRCCSALKDLGLLVFSPNTQDYQQSITSYWSTTSWLTPSCIVQPKSVVDVSTIVKTIANGPNRCQFAVRSGGHMPWAGASNIKDGVTIDLSLMKSTTVNAANNTATILPGAHWGDVYATLDAQNLATSGGRASTVGAGGLVIGGGNSFYAARKGLVCDNVAQFEIVLASGEIAYANNKTNPDLFQALKGGHANFGIVTRYDLVTFSTDGLWGGTVFYPDSTTSKHLQAFENFANNVESDPFASTISIWQYASDRDSNLVFQSFVYTKPVEYPAAFDDFFSIKPEISNSMRITTISNLTSELGVPSGQRELFMTNTFVNDGAVLKRSLELHNETIARIKAGSPKGTWGYVSMLQPIPPIFTKHSQELGGNVLGLDRFLDKNLVMFLAFPTWSDAADDKLFTESITWQINEINKFAALVGKDIPWIYTNYADKSQDPLKGYGAENVEKIRRVARKYDPKGVFQTLMPGGFKISQVKP